MSVLDKIYEKIKGGYFAFLALASISIGILIALSIYLTENPSFSILTNYISDLGVEPIGSRVFFSIGMILGAVFLIFLFLHIAKYLHNIDEKSQRIWIFLFPGLIAEIGLIFIGIFPLDRTNDASFTIHAIAAILFFIFTAISNLGFGYIEFKNSEFSKLFALISVIAGIFSAIFAIGFIFQEFSVLEDQPFIYLSEWIFFAFTTIWLIIHGIIFLKKGEK